MMDELLEEGAKVEATRGEGTDRVGWGGALGTGLGLREPGRGLEYLLCPRDVVRRGEFSTFCLFDGD